MKLLLILFLAVSSLSAATYYQDFATGNDANNGLSWAAAKKTLPIISGGGGGPNCSRWNTHAANPIGFVAGDTLYLSGGSSSVTIDMSGGWEPPSGAAGNPITYKIGQDTGRNGTLIFNYNASFGGAAQWINGPHDVVISGIVGADIATLHFKLTNWPRRSTATPTVQRSFGLASIGNNFLIEGVDATDGLSSFIENPGSVNFSGFEMRYCRVYCDDTDGNAIVSLAGPDTPYYAANKVHHCTLRGTYTTGGNGYDIFKGSGGMSMYDNFMYWVRDANYVIPGQHADGWQGGGGSYMEFYNNTVLNCTNYGVYAEATVATVPNSITPGWAHLRIYNNVFTMTDPALQSGTGPIAICIGPNTSVWNTQLFYGEDIVVANNDIVDCSTLPQITMNVNAGQTGVWTNVRIQNNVIVNCGTGALDLRGNPTSTVSNNLLNLSSSTAASSFLSYTANAGTANNLSLSATATSLLDQGLSLSPLFTMDKAGKLRVGAWDIGAFEFAGGSTDTTAPSVPANLGGAAASTTQINLTWTASTDNIGVTGYSVYRNNALAGTTATTTYTDTGLTAATTYTYSLSAYDAAGNLSARSASVNVTTLTTELPPVITTQPQSLTTVASGASFTLSVIATGTGLTYQWKKDGNAISGATSATYTVASMSAGNAGAYTVVVTNSLGSVTSATANVSLTVAPSNAIISITVN